MVTYYTGIGSRQTPPDVLLRMKSIARALAIQGWVLRSGGADGADTAFEMGCDDSDGKKEIYLPWCSFNGSSSPLYLSGFSKEQQTLAYHIARSIHPAWDRCTPATKKLHVRNVFQVLGWDLNTLSELVICWTKDGITTGGTATAINLAKQRGIRVINLAGNPLLVYV